MNCKIFILIFFSLFCSFKAVAGQDSLRISISAPHLKNTEIKLCAHFNEKIYRQDSIKLSGNGTGIFHRPEKLSEGLYMIYVDSLKYIDILLADKQSFQIEIDTSDMIGKTKLAGSEQSEAFLRYAQYIADKQKIRKQLNEQFKALQAESKNTDQIIAQMKSLNQEVTSFQHTFQLKYNNQWVGKFFHGLDPVTTGPFPLPANQDEAYTEFKYQKNHYFDNIDLQDPRFWRTSYFPQKITAYMQNQVESVPDSLANAASRLVSMTMGDSTCFQLMFGKLIDFSVKSNIMGMDNIWAKLIEDYFLKGSVTWLDSTMSANMRSEYAKVRYNRIGMKAKNIPLVDITDKPINLYDAGTDYTLVYFYEPSCGHCQKITPRIHDELYEKYKDKGLSVACIYTFTDKKEWEEFISQHQLEGKNWQNLWDPGRKSYFWDFFDTSSTPAIYLLDKDKTIIAKKLNVETLDDVLNRLINPE